MRFGNWCNQFEENLNRVLRLRRRNSANKPSFQNPEKGLFAEHSLDGALGKMAFCQILFIGQIKGQNVQRLQIFAILPSFL